MTASPTLLVVAGEASGDLHAGALVREIRARAPAARILAVGGTHLESAGATLIHRIDDLTVVGITEVLRSLPRILKVLRALRRRLRSGAIDLFIPVDFPDFNFRLATTAHAAGIPVLYFIAPQLWAWRGGRLRQMSRWCDHLAVLFPFEKEFFARAGIPVTYAGHPLVRAFSVTRDRDSIRRSLGVGPGERLVALLPGSRTSEVRRHLPIMVAAVERLAGNGVNVRAAIGRAPTIDHALIERFRAGVPVMDPPAADLAAASDLVFCASGTATVEVALAGTPMVVVYRLSPMTWLIAKRLVKVDRIAMANLAAGERLVPELLQGRATPAAIAAEAAAILGDPSRAAEIRAGYARVRAALSGGEGLGRVAEVALALARGTAADG
jgi:lipid-A-disaccharide synthase